MPDPHILAKIEERKARWLNLYRPESLGARLFLIHYLPDLPERPWPHLSNSVERVDWAWSQYQQQLAQMEWLEDDTIPFLDMYTGTEIFAAAFGCKVYYPEQDMPFAMPLIHAWEEVEQVQMPDLDAPVIASLFQMADELQRRAGPGALLRMVDLQTPMDIAALIWDKTTFYPALLQQPDSVRQLSHQVLVFMTRFLDSGLTATGVPSSRTTRTITCPTALPFQKMKLARSAVRCLITCSCPNWWNFLSILVKLGFTAALTPATSGATC